MEFESLDGYDTEFKLNPVYEQFTPLPADWGATGDPVRMWKKNKNVRVTKNYKPYSPVEVWAIVTDFWFCILIFFNPWLFCYYMLFLLFLIVGSYKQCFLLWCFLSGRAYLSLVDFHFSLLGTTGRVWYVVGEGSAGGIGGIYRIPICFSEQTRAGPSGTMKAMTRKTWFKPVNKIMQSNPRIFYLLQCSFAQLCRGWKDKTPVSTFLLKSWGTGHTPYEFWVKFLSSKDILMFNSRVSGNGKVCIVSTWKEYIKPSDIFPSNNRNWFKGNSLSQFLGFQCAN